MHLRKRIIAGIVTFIIMTVFMMGLCPDMTVMTYADTNDEDTTYDLTFTSNCFNYSGTRTVSDVRINTEETHFGYGILGEIIKIDGRFMKADDISTVGPKDDSHFHFSDNDKEFWVKKPFSDPITIIVRGYQIDWLVEVEVTCKEHSPKYTVTVTDDGHGTGSADPAKASAGKTITLFARPDEGYRFKEWQVKEGGVTIKNDQFKMPENNVIVMAIFEKLPPGKCMVFFDANGGKGHMSPQEITKDAPTALKPNTFTRDGYTFNGWNTSADGSGTAYANGEKITAGKDVTLYAMWKEKEPETYSVNVTYSDGGTAIANRTYGKKGDGVILTATADKGYRFSKWEIIEGDASIDDTTKSPATLTIKGDVTVKAVFVPESAGVYTITFDPNGGRVDPKKVTTDEEGKISQLPEPEYDGFDFTGWYTDREGGTKITTQTVFTSDQTVYAHWTKKGSSPEPAPEETKPAAAVNPNTVLGFYSIYGQPYPGAVMGKMKQGPAAQAVLDASRPKGWIEAFTFNLTLDGKTDDSLKNGVMTVIIPEELRKSGRMFAIVGIDKNGKTKIFADIDTDPVTVTAKISIEGYAFELINRDQNGP